MNHVFSYLVRSTSLLVFACVLISCSAYNQVGSTNAQERENPSTEIPQEGVANGNSYVGIDGSNLKEGWPAGIRGQNTFAILHVPSISGKLSRFLAGNLPSNFSSISQGIENTSEFWFSFPTVSSITLQGLFDGALPLCEQKISNENKYQTAASESEVKNLCADILEESLERIATESQITECKELIVSKLSTRMNPTTGQQETRPMTERWTALCASLVVTYDFLGG